MRVCPKCGYTDPFCWRDAYSRGSEMDYTRIDELKLYQPELAEKILKQEPDARDRRVYCDQYFAYGLWPSGYVRRRFIEIYKHHGWKGIPMEVHS